ncbi:MAG: hypothetical protein WCK87_02870 [Candidatus Saccharibacteria bacterium]
MKAMQISKLSVSQLFDQMKSRLSAVPELETALQQAVGNINAAFDNYSEYVQVIERMTRLTETERKIIQNAKRVLETQKGSVGSASKVSASDILNELGDRKVLLTEIVLQSTDVDSQYYGAAMNELVVRMERGHQLKLSGKKFVDGDPESSKVIWGHTLIAGETAMLNFVICHYLERYFAVALTDKGLKLAQEKDFFLNAMIDVIIIDHLSAHSQFGDIFDLWSRSKDQGGLGWIVHDRLNTYQSM